MKTFVSMMSLIGLTLSAFAMAEITPPPAGERHVIGLDAAQSAVVSAAVRSSRFVTSSQVVLSDIGITCNANQYTLRQASSHFLGNDFISCIDRSDCHSARLTPGCQISTLETPGTDLSDAVKLH